MEREALRVLALGRRRLPDSIGDGPDEVERDLELLGLVGMIDPPRPKCRRRCGGAARPGSGW